MNSKELREGFVEISKWNEKRYVPNSDPKMCGTYIDVELPKWMKIERKLDLLMESMCELLARSEKGPLFVLNVETGKISCLPTECDGSCLDGRK